MKKVVYIVAGVLGIINLSSAQPGLDSATYAALKNQLVGVYGSSMWLDNVVNIDSSVQNRTVADGLIENPYGTLTGCYIFVGHLPVGSTKEKLFVGVYRSNQIVWRLDTVVSVRVLAAGHVFAIRDLNRDGNVEIVVSWLHGPQMSTEYLWVYRWTGQAGAIITSTDDQGFSTIVSLAGVLRLADVEGDGIWEIQGGWRGDDTLSTSIIDTLITYGFSGQLYGKWPSTPQPLIIDWLPMNRFQATVSAKVARTVNGLRFSYRLANHASSLQAIRQVIIDYRVDSVSQVTGPNGWWFPRERGNYPSWVSVVAPPYRDIQSGQTDSSFGYESTGLPTLAPFYLLGGNAEPLGEVSGSSWENNVLTNSISGFTIAPASPPSLEPFASVAFTDTLLSYTTRSRVLNWILDQSTANKYTVLFTRTKSDLQSANVPAARSRLDTVLQQVRVDSVASLTSEAYALLRFNTEYLDTVLARTTIVNYPANWNLVSVPRVTATFKGTELFPTLLPGALYGFDGSYYLVDTLRNGVGYWAGLSQATTVTFTGSTLTQTSRTVPREGWWFAGSISKSVPLANLTSNPPGLIVAVYGWENQYVIPTQLEPGKGYWVRVTGACTLNISQ